MVKLGWSWEERGSSQDQSGWTFSLEAPTPGPHLLTDVNMAAAALKESLSIKPQPGPAFPPPKNVAPLCRRELSAVQEVINHQRARTQDFKFFDLFKFFRCSKQIADILSPVLQSVEVKASPVPQQPPLCGPRTTWTSGPPVGTPPPRWL